MPEPRESYNGIFSYKIDGLPRVEVDASEGSLQEYVTKKGEKGKVYTQNGKGFALDEHGYTREVTSQL